MQVAHQHVGAARKFQRRTSAVQERDPLGAAVLPHQGLRQLDHLARLDRVHALRAETAGDQRQHAASRAEVEHDGAGTHRAAQARAGRRPAGGRRLSWRHSRARGNDSTSGPAQRQMSHPSSIRTRERGSALRRCARHCVSSTWWRARPPFEHASPRLHTTGAAPRPRIIAAAAAAAAARTRCSGRSASTGRCGSAVSPRNARLPVLLRRGRGAAERVERGRGRKESALVPGKGHARAEARRPDVAGQRHAQRHRAGPAAVAALCRDQPRDQPARHRAIGLLS